MGQSRKFTVPVGPVGEGANTPRAAHTAETHESSHVLAAEARSVPQARALVRDAVLASGGHDYLEPALLATSELVTNAVVHSGTEVVLIIEASTGGLRVRIGDGNARVPAPRSYSATAGTGRGLHLVEDAVDRWGVDARENGKYVWFELGTARDPALTLPAEGPNEASGRAAAVDVLLLRVPLLMHWAWQEHAAALLREYLLFKLDDDFGVLDEHAQASDALDLLHTQVPTPSLPDAPEELMAEAVEPAVSAARVTVSIPDASVAHFAVLDDLLARAVAAAEAEHLLAPPSQPEISEMRSWLCREVADQATGSASPRPWEPRTDVRTPVDQHGAMRPQYEHLLAGGEPVLITDEASVIVAVAEPVVRFLGYAAEADLVGRRVIAVVPSRFHQAHIAGTTLHAVNGRDVLLGVPITVPVHRADGSERDVQLTVTVHRLDAHHRVFLAHFDLPA